MEQKTNSIKYGLVVSFVNVGVFLASMHVTGCGVCILEVHLRIHHDIFYYSFIYSHLPASLYWFLLMEVQVWSCSS